MTNPEKIVLDMDKTNQWIKNGAQPTDTVKALISKASK
jgi:small subunit ribosomal protein S16